MINTGVINYQANLRYILDPLLSAINVSVQMVDIANSLPKLTFENNKEDSI